MERLDSLDRPQSHSRTLGADLYRKAVCVIEDIADSLDGGLVKTAAAQYSAKSDESLAMQREAEKFITETSANESAIKKAA